MIIMSNNTDFKKYSAYKDSGIEWIGNIPEHWEAKKLKYLMMNSDSRRVPLSSEQRAEMQGDYPYYGSNGIVDHVNDFLFDGEYILLGEDGAPFFETNKDVAFSISGKFWVNNHAHILKAFRGYNQRFLTHALNCVDYRKHITGSTRDKLTQDDMSSIELPITTRIEQNRIASYLDHKTAQIDNLIAKKERMIELLKEERTAIINQAVTKGLDPDVEMKDSGIEWLGKIPKHWEVKKLKYVANKVQTGITPPSERTDYYDGGNIDWYTPGDFRESIQLRNSFRKINKLAIEKGVARMFLPYSVLLIGIGATLGKVGIIEKLSSSNQQINAITFSDKFNPFFGAYYLQAIANTVISLSNASTLAILNQTQTKDILMLVPPLEEQGKIVQYIQSVELKHAEIVNKEQEQIDLLKEYRTALISEVVTGKIDVKDL